MSDGLLPSSDSTGSWGEGHDHQKSHRNVPTNFKAYDFVCPGRTYRVESRTHSLSDVRTERNNAAPHAAEIAVASHRVVEIE